MVALASPSVDMGKGATFAPGGSRPKWLKGELPGDVGFDPLKLGEDPEALAWYVQAELVHARFAMAATAGILIPGALTRAGVLAVPAWYEAGEVANDGKFATFGTLLTVQIILMGFAETRRWLDVKNPGSMGATGSFSPGQGFEKAFGGTDKVGYPGGIFDPLGLYKNGDAAKQMDLKNKEIANGRLAMLAMLGFYGQHGSTEGDPIDNWLAHIADPWHVNVATNALAVPWLKGGYLN